ncbi:MAG: PVC-type heme-binding CxxCH protein [Pirellulaceae bacterium]
MPRSCGNSNSSTQLPTVKICHSNKGIGCALALAVSLLANGISSGYAAKPAASDHAVVEALMRLPEVNLNQRPEAREAVLRYLRRNVGNENYARVANRLQVFDQVDELTEMLTASEGGNLAVEAARMMARGKHYDALETLLRDSNAERAVAAARVLGYLSNDRVLRILQTASMDSDLSLQLRIAAADAVGRSTPGQRFLLGKVKSGELPESLIFVVRERLLSSKDKNIAQETGGLLQAKAATKSETLPPINQLVGKRGDATHGQQVFAGAGTCNKCHVVREEGREVGPDLSEIGSKLSREDMYVAILNPSAAISHNYENYTLLDEDDRVLSGLLINKTDESVTIRDAEGIDHSLDADAVVSLKVQSISLMPSDLQKAISTEELTDLVEYLLTLRKPQADASGGSSAAQQQVAAQPEASPSEAVKKHDPYAAVEGFDVAEGVDVQLFACEPQLLSPTSIDVDAQGRVWVCEAVNYRHFRNEQNEERAEGDRILVLEDTDGDGVADKRTVFYQDPEIDSPHGVCVLGDQIIVSAGSNVIVFTDKDGDLKPDSKRYLFTGISGVQHDHGIHAFNIGPDGKLYFNFGNAGKQLKGPNGETIIDKAGNVVDDSRQPYQEGMVFRCNLDGSELETLGWNFRNNWEVCVDSFGTMWQSDNDDDGNRGTRINYVMEFGNYGYRDEKTGATWKVARTGIEGEIPLQHWHLNDPGVMPNILQTGAGSPTGICFYEGTLLPDAFQNQVIHTDPGPSVVRAYPVEATGAGYKASIRNLIQGVDDPWFRPVDVCAAPDGSLFVADWYDPGVGGHRMGDVQHGRIFRVVPKGHSGYDIPKLDLTTEKGAVDALQSPNLATRFMAQKAIDGMGNKVRVELEGLAGEGNAASMRARAYWQLALLGTAEPYIETLIADPNPDLRALAIRMARQHGDDLLLTVEKLVRDPSPKVRREVAIALRHLHDPLTTKLWVELALQHDGKDRWYLEALGIAADKQWDTFFDAWLARVGDNWNSPAGRDIVWRCRSPKACRYLAELIAAAESEDEQYRYFRAFDFHEGEPKLEALNSLLSISP